MTDIYSCTQVDRAAARCALDGDPEVGEDLVCRHLDLVVDEPDSLHMGLIDARGEIDHLAVARFVRRLADQGTSLSGVYM